MEQNHPPFASESKTAAGQPPTDRALLSIVEGPAPPSHPAQGEAGGPPPAEDGAEETDQRVSYELETDQRGKTSAVNLQDA